jgi:predicted XRE-type DNA-binding protein
MSLKISKQTKRGRDDTAVFVGNGNVFQDLGRPDAAEALAKVELAYRIHRLIEDSGLTQTQAARRLGVDQPKVSNLMRGRLKDFSIERLFRFLNLLGQDVEVRVRNAKRNEGSVRVYARAS